MRYDVSSYYLMPLNVFLERDRFWNFGNRLYDIIRGLRSFYVYPRYKMEMLGQPIGGKVSIRRVLTKDVGP